MCYILWYNAPTMLLVAGSLEAELPGYWLATSWVHCTTSCNKQSSAPEDGQNKCPKHVEPTGIINKPLLLHLVGCLYYLYQWCVVKQISDNEIYLLIKYMKSVLWRVAKHLSYIEDARCLKIKAVFLNFVVLWALSRLSLILQNSSPKWSELMYAWLRKTVLCHHST